MKVGKLIGVFLWFTSLLLGNSLYAQLQFDTAMVQYASSTEQELLKGINELDKKELLKLVFIADNPFIDPYNITKATQQLDQIAQRYNVRKYQKGDRVKAATKIYDALAKNHYLQHDPTADLTDLLSKGRTTLGSFIVLVAYVYETLNIPCHFYTDEFGFHARLYPEEEDYPMDLGVFDNTMESLIIGEFLKDFAAQGNLSTPFNQDSMKANTFAKTGGFWKKMVQLQYMYTATEQVQKGLLEDGFNTYLKAYMTIPNTLAYVQVFGSGIAEIALKQDLSDFEESREKWTFLINNFNSVAENNLLVLYEKAALDETQLKARLDKAKTYLEYFEQYITDQDFLKSIRFTYYSGLAYYRCYDLHSRDFLRPYLKAKELSPDHLRLKDMAFNGMYNYMHSLPSTELYDTFKVFEELIPEVQEHVQYDKAKFRACIVKCFYLLETSNTKALSPYYTELKGLGCPNDPSLEPMTRTFFAEYSAYNVRQNRMSTGRSILLDGIKLLKACEIDDSLLQERYKYIKDVKSLR